MEEWFEYILQVIFEPFVFVFGPLVGGHVDEWWKWGEGMERHTSIIVPLYPPLGPLHSMRLDLQLRPLPDMDQPSIVSLHRGNKERTKSWESIN